MKLGAFGKRSLLLLFLPFWLVAPLFAGASAIRPTDLGDGLAYWRVQRLPTDLPSGEDRSAKSLILDLRGIRREEGSVAALAAWLEFRASPARPLFVLLNASTDKALLRLLDERTWPGLVTLGPAALSPAPDIPVSVTNEQDAGACAALARGVTPDRLLSQKIEKERRDEAQLNRAYAHSEAKAPVPGSTPGKTEPEKTASRETVAPAGETSQESPTIPKESMAGSPVDTVLARAVHLHKTLLALRRLQPTSG